MATGKLAFVIAATWFSALAISQTLAEDRNWKDPVSGSFHDGAKWLEGSPPGAADRALFNLSSAGYTVTFSGNVANDAMEVFNDTVTLELGASTYTLANFLYVGLGFGGNAELTLHGNAAEVFGSTQVGVNKGAGLLRIEGGAVFTTHNDFSIGVGNPGAVGTVIVRDAGTLLQVEDCCGLRAGQDSGNVGNLTIENNATAIFGAGSHIVGLAGGEGFLTLLGGAQLTLTDGSSLEVGAGNFIPGIGHVLIQSGAQLDSEGITLIATNVPTSFGEITLIDTPTHWETTGGIEVGLEGTGTLDILNGATVHSLYGSMAGLATGDGTATVSGNGSRWDMDGVCEVGVRGHGVLVIENGGEVTSDFAPIAALPGSIGEVTVSGMDSTWTSGGILVGGSDGTLSVLAGGSVITNGMAVGGGAGNVGELIVDGSGSTVEVLLPGGTLFVSDYEAAGTMTISNGGQVSNDYTVIGYVSPGVGNVSVSGIDSDWILSSGIVVGWGGHGTLTVESGGNISMTLGLEIALDPTSTGIVSVIDALSTMTMGDYLEVGRMGNGQFVLANGATASALRVMVPSSSGSGELTISDIGSTLVANQNVDIGTFGVGIVNVTDGGLLNADSVNLLGPNATLKGNGTIEVSPGSINNVQGVMSPGDSPGIQTINGQLNQGTQGTLRTELGGLTVGTQHDQLAISSSANLAGRLELDLISGFVPSAGDSFDIITYGSVSGRFQTIISDNLPPGLQWALDYNPTVLTLIACDPVADPSCDDCNRNGILDGEDIANLTSLDVDLDGIPDECANFVAACFPPTDEWDCFDNWDLPGDQYPDDVASASGVFVTLNETDDVTLNVDATIPALRILDDAELHATGGLLNVYGSSDTHVESNLFAGDFDIDLPNSRLVLAPGGVYEKDSAELDAVAELTASSAYLFGNACTDPPCPHGGEMNLDDDMAVTITGNLTLDGRLSDGPCELRRIEQSFHTPPSIRVIRDSRINVAFNFAMQGAAGFVHQSTEPVTVGGDWDNQGTSPECFDCRNGTVILTGASAHNFEVAGTDVGAVGTVDDPGAQFVMGGLEIQPDATVTIRDNFDNNGVGPATCGEALYVETLTLGAGSTTTVENCRVYYQTLVGDPTATVTLNGCGELMSVIPPNAPGPDPSAINKGRAISIVPPAGASEFDLRSFHLPLGYSAIRVTLTSLHHVEPPYTGGPSIQFDSFEGQVRWVGPPLQYVESTSNPTPFKASTLQCTPYYQNWNNVGLLHIFGSAIVPSSSYQVQVVSSSCEGIEGRCTAVSAPLTVNTTRWGDVETPYNPPSPTVQPDVGDIGALVNKFRSVPGAPIKARALLAGNDSFGNITSTVLGVDFDFSHIAACVDAFRGRPYPYTIQACP